MRASPSSVVGCPTSRPDRLLWMASTECCGSSKSCTTTSQNGANVFARPSATCLICSSSSACSGLRAGAISTFDFFIQIFYPTLEKVSKYFFPSSALHLRLMPPSCPPPILIFFPDYMEFSMNKHGYTRRRLILSMGALAALTACGGQPGTPSVIDRQINVGTGVTLHVRDWTSSKGDDKDVIVLLAGLGGNAHAFDSLAPALAGRRRVLAITRRGYGQSSKPAPIDDTTYAPATLAADLLAVLDALKVDRIILAGHSIAGNEVTLFAGSHPQRVRGIVYLDTTYDYSRDVVWTGEDIPDNPIMDTPEPQAADLASMSASLAYAKRIHKHWWPAMEAYWRDTLDVLPDGSVQPNTPPAIALAMAMGAKTLTPDYRAVRAPALVIVAQPSTLPDMMPWITPQTTTHDLADARAWLRIYPQMHGPDCQRIAAALPGSTLLTINNASHSDFFIEYATVVVKAIEAMRWEK